MRLGVDVGGTFTDLLLHDEVTQRTYQAKTPSTPEDQSIGVAAGVKLICEKAGISPREISLILHGTTGSGTSMLSPAFAGELFGPGQPLDVRASAAGAR